MKFSALLASALFVPLIAFATPGGIGSSLQKGLVGHWPLTGESEKTSDNLIINGTFDVDSNWTKQTGWDILGGTANFDASVLGKITQLGVYRVGVKSILKFDIVGSNSARLGLSNTGITTISYAPGTHVLEFTPTAEDMIIWGYTGFPSFSIDNISVKEIKTADTTPYDNHGTIYGATSATGPHGEADGAMSFDGTNDYITFNALNPIGTEDYSFCMKVKFNGVASGTDLGLIGSASYGVNIYENGGRIVIGKSGVNDTTVINPLSLLANTLYDIVITRNGTSGSAYLNGTLVKTFTDANDYTVGVSTLGSRTIYGGTPLNGILHDVRIYNRALTADEVSQLYNEGGKTVVTQKPSLETGLVGHWALNGESEAWTELSGDAWQNSTAYGRTTGTNYFSQNGNTIEVVNTGSSWFGAGKMYATSEKGKYKIHIKTNTLNGTFIPAFHLYKNGTRVTYTSAQVPTTTTFTSNHVSGFNYGQKSTPGIYEATDVIDLTNAPDFDAIHVSLLSYQGTSSPYLRFQSTDIFVKQLVTADSTPYDNHGKINGAVLATGPNGETNGAMSFDGSNDYVNCGTNSILDNEEALSVSAWIKTSYDAPFPGEIGIVKKGTGASSGWITPGWSLRLRDDIPAFALRKKDDTGYWDLYTGSPVIDGEWHHIVGTFDTTSIRKYVDGTQTQTASTGQPYLVSNGNCNIGKITNLFNGSISDVRIYNRVLTTEEITQLYEDKAKLMGNKVPSLESGLVGHWPLSGGYTNPSVFSDITPYDNHGTSSSTTLSSGPSGRITGATTFDETTDLEIPNNANNNLTNTDDFSLSIWVKKGINPVDGNVFGIFAKSGKYGIDYTFGEKQIRAGIRNTTDGQYQVTYLDPTEMLDWTHITMVYKSETIDGLRLYVNGELKNSRTTIGLSDFSSTQNLFIGGTAAVGGSPRSFNGDLFDARLYNRALSADEIKRLYEVR